MFFIKYEKSLSANTFSSYSIELDRFFSSIGDVFINELTEEILENYLSFCSKKYKVSSVSHTISVLRSFFSFLFSDGLIKNNFSKNLIFPKLPFFLPDVLDYDEVVKFINFYKFDKSPIGVRNLAIVEILYSTGCRVSELSNLTFSSYIDSATPYFIVFGKNNKQRIVFLNSSANLAYKNYVFGARSFFVAKSSSLSRDNNFIFLNLRGKKLSRQSVWEIISSTAKLLSFSKPIYPHSFRHSFATHLLAGGADILSVKELLGHSSINTTQIYTHISLNYLKDIFFSSHPRL